MHDDDQWDEDVERDDEEEDSESAAGDVEMPGRLARIGARASLLLGLGAMGVVGIMDRWPTVSHGG